MTRLWLLVIMVCSMSSCSSYRRMQKDLEKASGQMKELIARKDTAESHEEVGRQSIMNEDRQSMGHAALVQWHEEYYPPDSTGKQYRKSRTFTRARGTGTSSAKVTRADSTESSSTRTNGEHEYKYDNHWTEEVSKTEEEERKPSIRWYHILAAVTGFAAVYIAFKKFLNREKS